MFLLDALLIPKLKTSNQVHVFITTKELNIFIIFFTELEAISQYAGSVS